MEMTTKELATALNVGETSIKNTVAKLRQNSDELFNSILKNKQGGYLFNEEQATAIKLELQNHSKVNELTPKTQLEENLIVQKAMRILVGRQVELEKQLEEAKPALTFYKSVTGSNDVADMGTVAKTLGVGRNKLFDILRTNGILMANNKPYQKYVDAGYFRIIETTFNTPDGDTHVNFKTVVYQKGVEFINRKLKEAEIGR